MKKKLAKSSVASVKAPRKSKAKPIKARVVPPPVAVRALALPGDPYVTGKGKIIHDPDAPKSEAQTRARSFKAKKRRTIKELPALPNVLRGIACVLVCSVLGLSDREIADLLGISLTDVKEVRKHNGYTETFEIVANEFVSASSDRLHSRIASYAEDALTNVHSIAMGATKEETKLRANIDLLDRGGVRPKDNEARNAQQGNELRITVIKAGDVKIGVNGIAIDVETNKGM